MAEEYAAVPVVIKPLHAAPPEGYIPPVTLVTSESGTELKMKEDDPTGGSQKPGQQQGSRVKLKLEGAENNKWKLGHSRQKSLPINSPTGAAPAG